MSTSDRIRELALKHGFTLRPQPGGDMDLNAYVYAFARAILAVERERCAAECDRLSVALDHGGNAYRREASASQCAAAIRALGDV